jgi:hypothetical protein
LAQVDSVGRKTQLQIFSPDSAIKPRPDTMNAPMRLDFVGQRHQLPVQAAFVAAARVSQSRA